MGACRYGIYLRVFNLIAHAWAQSYEWDEKRNFISTSNHALFFYQLNTIALCWQYFINEWNERIDNLRIETKSALAQARWKHALITIKTNNGRNFSWTKFSVIDLVLTDRRNLSRTQNRPVANLPVVDCRSQPQEMPLPKPLNA